MAKFFAQLQTYVLVSGNVSTDQYIRFHFRGRYCGSFCGGSAYPPRSNLAFCMHILYAVSMNEAMVVSKTDDTSIYRKHIFGADGGVLPSIKAEL